jgi:hypothetical protein
MAHMSTPLSSCYRYITHVEEVVHCSDSWSGTTRGPETIISGSSAPTSHLSMLDIILSINPDDREYQPLLNKWLCSDHSGRQEMLSSVISSCDSHLLCWTNVEQRETTTFIDIAGALYQ